MIRLRYAALTAVLMLGVSPALAQTATSPAASSDASGGGQTLCPANQPNCQPGKSGTKGKMGIQSPNSQSGTSGSLSTQQKLQGGTRGSTAGDTSGSGSSTKKKVYSNSTGGSSGTSNETTGSVKSGTTGTASGSTSGTASSNSSSTTNITISSTQQTKVKQVIMQASPPKVTESIQVSVGTVVPQTVSSEMEACPADLIQIAPGLSVIRSDCKYFVLPDGEIVFVDANTMKVVYVIS